MSAQENWSCRLLPMSARCSCTCKCCVEERGRREREGREGEREGGREGGGREEGREGRGERDGKRERGCEICGVVVYSVILNSGFCIDKSPLSASLYKLLNRR